MRQRQKDNTSRVIEVIKIGRRSDQRGRGEGGKAAQQGGTRVMKRQIGFFSPSG